MSFSTDSGEDYSTGSFEIDGLREIGGDVMGGIRHASQKIRRMTYEGQG